MSYISLYNNGGRLSNIEIEWDEPSPIIGNDYFAGESIRMANGKECQVVFPGNAREFISLDDSLAELFRNDNFHVRDIKNCAGEIVDKVISIKISKKKTRMYDISNYIDADADIDNQVYVIKRIRCSVVRARDFSVLYADRIDVVPVQ